MPADSAKDLFTLGENATASTPLPDGSEPDPGISVTPRRSRRRLWLTLLGVPLVLALVGGIGVSVAAWRIQNSIDDKISRFGDPFADIPAADRPAQPAGEQAALNLLVFGSDSRISAGDPTQWEAGAQRTDAIMLVHIPADRSGAFVMSIPRDTWVTVPGHGKAKINAAFSWGGPALAIRTVEQLTGVTIDHMVITDFTGFARITDLLGGVTITVPKTTTGNTHGQGENFAAGTYRMDGETALTYVRQRYVLPNGDFDRVKRQQNWIRAIMKSASSSGATKDPQRLLALLDAMASSLSTDSSFTIEEMRSLALSLRGVEPSKIKFFTVPVTGTGWSPDHTQSIVLLDQTKAATLWTAIADDTVDTWLTDSSHTTLPDTVR